MTKQTDITAPARQVAANIRALRTTHGWTTEELSRRLSAFGRPIPALGLRRIDRGERRIDVADLVVLAAIFNVPPAILLGPMEITRDITARAVATEEKN